MTIRTRFAPSPTGYLHIGGARTALYSWLYARHHGGCFVLRIEDTDLERSTPESVEAILSGMRWLGLSHDEGPFFQTQRFPRYREVVDKLLREGHAYHCYCSKEDLERMRAEQLARKEKQRYDRRCRSRSGPVAGVAPVVRFRNPTAGEVIVDDQIKGRVTFSNEELDDLVIARSDGTPTYNFTVVVDDWEMKITHVIRGDDHLNNTPRQINMLRALGAQLPVYAHVPMILGPDGSRLSKRHGAVSVLQYRDDGYLPDALLNYLVRLGWSHGDQEVFSREEMIQLFDIRAVHGSPAAFNPEKLLWLNQQHMKRLDARTLGDLLKPYVIAQGLEVDHGPSLAEVAAAQQDRAKTLAEMARSSRLFFEEAPPIEAEPRRKFLTGPVIPVLRALRARLAQLSAWTPETLHREIEETALAHGLSFGKLAQPLRVVIAGQPVSPPIDVTLSLVGQRRALLRLDRAMDSAVEGQPLT